MMQRSDPPGVTPWDRWNGARVGGIVGAIFGVFLPLLWGEPSFVLALAGAAVGAVAGYLVERARARRRSE